jgi:hypothetical protein
MPIMKNIELAFDRTARRYDADGRLHVDRTHISKATVNPYYGEEIPNWANLGLVADKIYQLFRPPEELEKAAPTFNRLPILSRHVPVTVDAPQPHLIVGAIGSDVEFNAPYLDASITIWDATSIAGIEEDIQRELSCAYRYVAVMESGEYEGKPYDGFMTNIQGNHLAIVEVGRAGHDVIVADANPFHQQKENTLMRKTKLGKALIAALEVASPKLAADSALPALVGDADRKTFDVEVVKSKLLAMDENMTPQQVDNIIDAVLGVEQNPEPVELGEGDSESDKKQSLPDYLRVKGLDEDSINEAMGLIAKDADCSDTVAQDSDIETEETTEEVAEEVIEEAVSEDVNSTIEAAMDSFRKELRLQYRNLDQAKQEVRKTVGEVFGMDTAEEVYGFALDQMSVEHEGVKDLVALRALYKVAAEGVSVSKPNLAQDSADAVKQFPGLARIRQL